MPTRPCTKIDRPRERGGACVPYLPGSSRARTAKANSVAAAAGWRAGQSRESRQKGPKGAVSKTPGLPLYLWID
jgi:hypothetical protein